MLLCRDNPMWPIAPVFLGDTSIKWVTKARVLGLTVDHKLTWEAHVMDVKESFATKLDLLKRSRFLPKSALRDFYFKVILPSVKYGLLLWGARTYLVQLKDFIVDHLGILFNSPSPRDTRQKRCRPTIGGLPFSYIIK